MSSILRTILQGVGVRDVVEARDAESAFEVCRDARPDVALVDYQLGGLTGIEFTQLIRTAPDSPNQHLPIILVTAHSERKRVMEAINSGINEFVVKPVSARALLGRVQAVIEKPRPFVRSSTYFGPCRRRLKQQNYRGPLRRAEDKDDAQNGAGDDAAMI